MEKSFLVVDDCRTTRRILSLYLTGAGYKTIAAANGVEAIEKLVATKVDFIITDLNMPQMDGLELTRWIRSNGMFKDIPILILTTDQDGMTHDMGIGAGASGVLTKPVTEERLLGEVKRIAEKAGGIDYAGSKNENFSRR